MRSNRDTSTVGYRSKGPDGDLRNCAISFSKPLLELLGNPERVAVIVEEPNDAGVWLLSVMPHPEGFKINFKPGSVQGEISVAWSILQAKAKEETGRLPCVYRHGRVDVYLTKWDPEMGDQPTIFGSWGRVLLP